jgi:excisionase family DNA binding protein
MASRKAATVARGKKKAKARGKVRERKVRKKPPAPSLTKAAWAAAAAKKKLTATERGLVSPEGWISVQSFARFFDVSEMSVYRLVEADKIPHVKLGRLVRLPKNAIEWYERQNLKGDKVLVPKGTAAREAEAAAQANAA